MKSKYDNFKDWATDKITEAIQKNNKLTLEELKNSYEFKAQTNLFEMWKNICTEVFFKAYPKKT